MANKPPDIKITGIRGAVPPGYLLGRVSPGTGDVELVSMQKAQSAGLIPSKFPPSGPAGGDLSGTYPNPNVSGWLGRLLDTAAPTNGQVMHWVTAASKWVAYTLLGLAPAGGTTGQVLTKINNTDYNYDWETPSGGSGALTNTHIFVGNASNVAADVAMSGDATITNTGVVTIKTDVALAGNPTTTTQAAGDSSTRIATDAFVTNAIANAIAGVNPAVAVNAATTSASNTSALTYNNGVAGIGATLTGANNVALTVDGFTFTTLGQRLLVKNDTQSPSGAFNGVYYVTQVQATLLPLILTRALDYDMASDINNTGAIPVKSGTANALTSWLLTSLVMTVGTDPLTYVEFSFAPTFANPTATASDVAVNGSATTFMRSDAAPAVQKASSSVFGLAKVDGTTIAAVAGVIGAKARNAVTSFAGQTGPTIGSTTKLMCGFGGTFSLTPGATGRVRIRVTGSVSGNTSGDTISVNNYFGTGTAPIAGAAVTGTAGNGQDYILTVGLPGGQPMLFSMEYEITGLTLSTAYWFDIGMAVDTGTCRIFPRSFIVEEF